VTPATRYAYDRTIVRTNGRIAIGRSFRYHREMSITPIGEAPATGGRTKLYSDDAERARAWRARQKERQPSGSSPVTSPQLAAASLTVSLERLGDLVRSHHEAVAAEVARVEEAIDVLSDPEAVAEALESARAEAARQVAEAEERAARERQARSAAEAAEREATQAANGAWERAEALEVDVAAAKDEAGSLRGARDVAARQHADEVEALVSSHGAELAEARSRWEEELALAAAGRAKAEGAAEQARAELARAQAAHDEAIGALRAESARAIEHARAEVTEMLSARYSAELDSVTARAEGQLAKQTAKAEGAAELASSRAAEVERLAAHIEELRTELARTRQSQGTGSAPAVRKAAKQPAQTPRQRRQAKPS